MRWDHLFADLEGQLAAERAAHFQADVAEMTRAERASVELSARLVAQRGKDITVVLATGDTVRGTVADAAAQWVLLTDDGRHVLVPRKAVTAVHGLGARARASTEVERRLSLGYALRALSRDRARVVVRTQASEFSGALGAVGADYVDVSTRPDQVTSVPFDAIMLVRQA
jgi:hypothetical protein